MASCLIHRYRGLAVLVRSYSSNFCFATAHCLRQRAASDRTKNNYLTWKAFL